MTKPKSMLYLNQELVKSNGKFKANQYVEISMLKATQVAKVTDPIHQIDTSVFKLFYWVQKDKEA